MSDENLTPLSEDELREEAATALPDKEVVSILDLNADLNLAIDAAAPIDLAVAANANVAAPIDAAVGANVLSVGSEAQALADQGALINQGIDADATANANQDSVMDQSDDTIGAAPADATAATLAEPAAAADPNALPATPEPLDPTAVEPGTAPAAGALPDPGAVPDPGALPDPSVQVPDTSSMLDGNLLNVDVNLDADADIAAPINGAVAANANVAAPIDAAVAANVVSVVSQAAALAQQDAIINQDITGSAEANSDQNSDIGQ